MKLKKWILGGIAALLILAAVIFVVRMVSIIILQGSWKKFKTEYTSCFAQAAQRDGCTVEYGDEKYLLSDYNRQLISQILTHCTAVGREGPSGQDVLVFTVAGTATLTIGDAGGSQLYLRWENGSNIRTFRVDCTLSFGQLVDIVHGSATPNYPIP